MKTSCISEIEMISCPAYFHVKYSEVPVWCEVLSSLKFSEKFLRAMPTGLFYGRKFVKYFEDCLDSAGVENAFKKENNNI